MRSGVGVVRCVREVKVMKGGALSTTEDGTGVGWGRRVEETSGRQVGETSGLQTRREDSEREQVARVRRQAGSKWRKVSNDRAGQPSA